MNLCQGQVDASMESSFTGSKGILNIMKKGKLRRGRLKYNWCYQPL